MNQLMDVKADDVGEVLCMSNPGLQGNGIRPVWFWSGLPRQADPFRFGSWPSSHTHPPTGTIHSPSALQCIRGGVPPCVLLWATHVPLTGTKAVGSAPEGVAG